MSYLTESGISVTSCLATDGKYHVREDEEIKSYGRRAFPKAHIRGLEL